MIKYILISVLIRSVLFSQEIIHTKTYENGNVEEITYHKKRKLNIEGRSVDVISLVKMERYHDNGVLSSLETYSFPEKYVESITVWYNNGQKRGVETYKDRRADGRFIKWFENGSKYVEGMFRNGQEEGVHTMWNRDGTIKEQRTWKNGKKISSKTF